MKKIVAILFYSLLITHHSFSQDSCRLKISLLTCAPGAELYSTFGHTALRVQDVQGSDEVFNYGTFDGFDPDFYGKFIRGKLLYSLSVQDFNDFMYQYQVESRSVQEQELNLTCSQATALYEALRTNAAPQNKDYRYDFLFDNCTTRARDIVSKKGGGVVMFKDILGEEKPTFRDLIYIYLNKANQDWSKFGIDLLLGAKMDREASNIETMFLPDNLLKGFDSAYINNAPLVKSKRTILEMPALNNETAFITPGVAFVLLLAFVAGLSFIKKGWMQATVKVVDFLLFFILGIIGIVLLFMWFGTDHALCANNYNLLWAFPGHFIMAFTVHKHTAFVKKYFRAVFIVSVLLIVLWAFLPQHLNKAVVPIILTIALRSWMIYKQRNDAAKRI